MKSFLYYYSRQVLIARRTYIRTRLMLDTIGGLGDYFSACFFAANYCYYITVIGEGKHEI